MYLRISAVVLLSAMAALPQPAVACSDLANICEMQAQHFQQQMDIAATPPYQDEGYYDDGYYDDSYDDGGYGGDWSAPAYSTAEMSQWIAEEQMRQQQAHQQARQEIISAHEQRLRDDPGYRQFVEGYWLPMPSEALANGGPCMVHFSRLGQGVILMGPNGDYAGAFLAMYGPSMPAPSSVETIQVSLLQTGDPEQTVRVFNTVTPWDEEMGMVFFAVPTIEAAMAGMTDNLDFHLSRSGQPLMDIEWHGGLAARDQMSACIQSQRTDGGA
jgi:hypothetical protein